MTEQVLTEGWFKLLNAAKWHYFTVDGRSLCRRWLYLGSGEFGSDLEFDTPSKDECVACWRKRQVQRRETVGG